MPVKLWLARSQLPEPVGFPQTSRASGTQTVAAPGGKDRARGPEGTSEGLGRAGAGERAEGPGLRLCHQTGTSHLRGAISRPQ